MSKPPADPANDSDDVPKEREEPSIELSFLGFKVKLKLSWFKTLYRSPRSWRGVFRNVNQHLMRFVDRSVSSVADFVCAVSTFLRDIGRVEEPPETNDGTEIPTKVSSDRGSWTNLLCSDSVQKGDVALLLRVRRSCAQQAVRLLGELREARYGVIGGAPVDDAVVQRRSEIVEALWDMGIDKWRIAEYCDWVDYLHWLECKPRPSSVGLSYRIHATAAAQATITVLFWWIK